MGITGLWDVLGEGEICSIADYAARFFEAHKRPLRIAVDEACWRFTNLTDEQVRAIRDGEPAANPVEKTILWRVLRLLKLNVQLLFVYDGPKRPWKRGKRGGGRVDFELTRLLHKMLDHLKIPYHQAPSEAEAECAKLNRLGIVDAVWSDDGDAFMFGCQTLIKQHKIGGKIVTSKSNEGPLGMVKVFTIDYLREKVDLDADSLVLFAMLAGGDYNLSGLRGCGPKNASLVSKREHGVASALCHASKEQIPLWREYLSQTLFTITSRAFEVPYTFPDWKALEHYRNPTVSTDAQLHTLRGLRQGWDRPMVAADLRVFLRLRFNFGTREFLKHLSPIFLVRALARATPEQRTENLHYGIQLKRTRVVKSKDGEEPPVKSETKISFSPLYNIHIDIGRPPEEEDWGKWAAKDGTPYDPTQDLEFEILDCFLRHGLPDEWREVEVPKLSRKRKTADATLSSSMEPITSGSLSLKKQNNKYSGLDGSDIASSTPEGTADHAPNARQTSTRAPSGSNAAAPIDVSTSQDKSAATRKKRKVDDKATAHPEGGSTTKECEPARPKFKIPRIISSALLDAAIDSRPPPSSHFADVDDFELDMGGRQAQRPPPVGVLRNHALTSHENLITNDHAAASTSTQDLTKTANLVAGGPADPTTIRALRQKSSLQGPPKSSNVPKLEAWNVNLSEVIDLT